MSSATCHACVPGAGLTAPGCHSNGAVGFPRPSAHAGADRCFLFTPREQGFAAPKSVAHRGQGVGVGQVVLVRIVRESVPAAPEVAVRLSEVPSCGAEAEQEGSLKPEYREQVTPPRGGAVDQLMGLSVSSTPSESLSQGCRFLPRPASSSKPVNGVVGFFPSPQLVLSACTTAPILRRSVSLLAPRACPRYKVRW